MSHCHIRWDSYKNNVYRGFSRLQQKEEFVDMTVAADGYLVKVHKSLMALASPYIGEMLLSAPCQHPVVFLNNVSHDILAYILDYIYTGEVYVPKEKISVFIRTAKTLKITGIQDIVAPMCNPFIDINSQLEKTDNKRKRKRNLPSPVRNDNQSTVDKQNFADANIDINARVISIPRHETQTSNLQNILGDMDDVPDMRPDSGLEPVIEDTQPQTSNLKNNEYVGISNSEPQNISMNFGNHGTEIATNDCGKEPEESLLRVCQSSQDAETNNYDNFLSNLNKNKVLNVNQPLYSFKIENSTVPTETNSAGCSGFGKRYFNAPVKQIIIHAPNVENLHHESNQAITPGIEFFNGDSQLNVKSVPNQNYTLEVQPTTTTDGLDNEIKDTSNLLDSTATSPLYMISTRGSLQLILNRYIYNKHHSARGGQKVRWRCIDYRIKHCKAFVDTDGDLIASRKHQHSHPFHDRQILKKGQKSKVFTKQDEAAAAFKNNDTVVDSTNTTEERSAALTNTVLKLN